MTRWTLYLMYHSLPISLSSFSLLEPFTEPLSLVTVIIYTIYLFVVHLACKNINSSKYPHRPHTVIVWQISWINYHCITAHPMLVFFLLSFSFLIWPNCDLLLPVSWRYLLYLEYKMFLMAYMGKAWPPACAILSDDWIKRVIISSTEWGC